MVQVDIYASGHLAYVAEECCNFQGISGANSRDNLASLGKESAKKRFLIQTITGFLDARTVYHSSLVHCDV